MINTDNINRLIETISKAPADHMIMNNWNEPRPCGTAHCIGGWAQVLGAPQDPRDRAKWYGINTIEVNALEFMNNDQMFGLAQFDMLPADQRKVLMLGVLNNLLATGHVDWDKQFIDAGLEGDEDYDDDC